MWEAANWACACKKVIISFYWHWSPYNDFDMNFPVFGYDEALITYIVAASSKHIPFPESVY